MIFFFYLVVDIRFQVRFPAVAGGATSGRGETCRGARWRQRRLRRRTGAFEIALAPIEISGHWKIQRSVPLVRQHSPIFRLQVNSSYYSWLINSSNID